MPTTTETHVAAQHRGIDYIARRLLELAVYREAFPIPEMSRDLAMCVVADTCPYSLAMTVWDDLCSQVDERIAWTWSPDDGDFEAATWHQNTLVADQLSTLLTGDLYASGEPWVDAVAEVLAGRE